MISEKNLTRLKTGLEPLGLSEVRMHHVGVNRCRNPQCLTRMSITVPTLMVPVEGTKIITASNQRYEAGVGECLVLPPDVEIDVSNMPDIRSGGFTSAVLVFDAETIELFGKLYGAQLQNWRMSPRWNAPASDELYSLISDWLVHIREFPAGLIQTRHRMAELLLSLARQGIAGNLLFQNQQRLRQRIKHLLALNPSKDWRVADITDKLGLSESTLRRQLRAEDTQFRELLEEVRLDHGVDLVMATDMPISQIAFDCGYQSQSRFAERFRLRFSLSPTELRATQTGNGGEVVSLDERRSAS